MANLTKLDVALMTCPIDMICALVAFGADQASIWTGAEPRDIREFYFELGRRVSLMRDKAWEKELGF